MSDLYSKLIGVPYKRNGRNLDGLDCLGLVLYEHKQRGITLPDYITPNTDSMIYDMVMEEKQLFKELSKPENGCIVVFKVRSYSFHVGIMLDDIRFLHIIQHRNVCIEKLTHPFWKDRIEGFYKWIQ